MIYYKTDEEIELIRKNCLLVCEVLTYVGSVLKPGLTGEEIDRTAEQIIRDHKAEPGFKGYRGFPPPFAFPLITVLFMEFLLKTRSFGMATSFR